MTNDQEYVVAYPLGCQPSPSGAGELLIQGGNAAVPLFQAVSAQVTASGLLADLGVAVVELVGCVQTRCGYPNDEGRPEHPLYARGLRDICGAGEVLRSAWLAEVAGQMRAAGARIWDGRPRKPARTMPPLRHFIIPFKETTFECLAAGLELSLPGQPLPAILAELNQRLLAE